MNKYISILVILLLILSIFQDETNKIVCVLTCILLVLMNIAYNQIKDEYND